MKARDLVTVVTWPIEAGQFSGRMRAGQFHAQRIGEDRTACGRPIGWPFFLKDVTRLIWREVRWRLTYVAYPGTMTMADFQDPANWERKWSEKCCQQCAKVRLQP